jgi:UDP-glucose 4-epimerase
MASLTNKRILVTGGAGFIGGHLVAALHDDNDVRVLDDCSAGSPASLPDDVTFIEGDIRDAEIVQEAIDGVDVVFHEAAIVSVPESVDDPLTTESVNVDGTLTILEVAREADARVVLASSAAIYGEPERVPVSESASMAPSSPYGIHKLSLDHYARAYHELYDVETVALRYFNVYGPGQTGGSYAGVIDVFRRQASTGGPITVEGDGAQTRDFVHVEDVVQANIAAATTEHVGEAYNVGSGVETSVLELAKTIQDVTHTDASIEHVAPREGDIENSCADISKIRDELGYEPTVRLADGLWELGSDGS